MLAYENEMFLDALSADGLLIAARGIGMEEVLAGLIRVHADPGNLVLVMGMDDREEEHFIRTAEVDGGGRVAPKRITSEFGAAERQKIYLGGGVLFVTTRILVVDLLTDRLPAHLVTGILVCRAHRTAESCQESFVLRLYRQKNAAGFIKAFSSSPVAFRKGFCQVSRVMRGLFVKNLYLWPRFHASVHDCLKRCSPEVVEMHIDMTQAMTSIQTSILDLVAFTIQELRRLNPSLDSYEELTVENSLARSFHTLLQRELDPVWHQLSWKTKQLVEDLRTLRTILTYLTQYDCITFHTFVSALATTENASRSGGWMLRDAAEVLFLSARERVFGKKEEGGQSKKPKMNDKEEEERRGQGRHLEMRFESSPKWKALLEVVEEAREAVRTSPAGPAMLTEKILVLTSDERTANQVQELLERGEEALMVRLYNRFLGERHGHIPEADSGTDSAHPERKEAKNKGKGKGKRSEAGTATTLTLTQMRGDEKDEEDSSGALSIPESPQVLVQSTHHGDFQLSRLVNELRPRFVVLYDAEVSAVRALEAYQARNPDGLRLRVYFLTFDRSTEEQAYLTALRREKEAFEHLAEERRTMAAPGEEESSDLLRGSDRASDAIVGAGGGANQVTRKGGGALSEPTPRIVVDMREFRSELPSLIHRRGVEIDPVTIEVGDYILTPEICVERKSVSDLIGSLQNGRLYNQATNMTRFYARPMLLIEFDHNKPFALQGRYYLSRDIASTDLVARLQLLTLHFPSLRILWSPGPHATAELFEELKKGRPQPDPAAAAGLTTDVAEEAEGGGDHRYNANIRDFVSKLPGVTTRNIFGLLNAAFDLRELLEFGEDDLERVLGGERENALALHAGLHERPRHPEEQQHQGGRGEGGRRRQGRQAGGGGGRFRARGMKKADNNGSLKRVG